MSDLVGNPLALLKTRLILNSAHIAVQNSRDSTTLTPVDVDDVEDGSSGAGLNNSLIVAVTVATGVAVFLLVAGCLAYLIYRRQQQIARR